MEEEIIHPILKVKCPKNLSRREEWLFDSSMSNNDEAADYDMTFAETLQVLP